MRSLYTAMAMAWVASVGVGALPGCGGDEPHVQCGDGVCAVSESAANCCEDCACPNAKVCIAHACVAAVTCGDGICSPSESSTSCCEDCGCSSGSSCKSGSCVKNAVCGDGKCDSGETQNNCCS